MLRKHVMLSGKKVSTVIMACVLQDRKLQLRFQASSILALGVDVNVALRIDFV
jgi:hypothetical protein